MKHVPSTVWDGLKAAEHAERSVFPIGGGWLEQTQWCLEAVDLVQAEEARLKAESLDGNSGSR